MNVIEQLVWRAAEPLIMTELLNLEKVFVARPNRLWSSAELAELMQARRTDIKAWAKSEGAQ